MQKKIFQTLLIAALMTPSMVLAKEGACEEKGATTETKCHCGTGNSVSEKTHTCMKCGDDWANPDALICSCFKPSSKYWSKICGKPEGKVGKMGGA